MTDPQPSCSEIARDCVWGNLSNEPNQGLWIPNHRPFVSVRNPETFDDIIRKITEALEAKQKTIEELQHKYDLAIEEVDKLARQLDFSETTLRAYESYRIFKQDSFREVDGGAPVKEIDPVKAFEVIEDLKAEVEALKKEIGNREV